MAKKIVSMYLDRLQNKGYNRYGELLDLYTRWKNDLEIKDFLEFLNITARELKHIKPVLGENTYNNFRGVALEEFCCCKLNKLVADIGVADLQIFRNERILTEEFFVLEDGKFNKITNSKNIDIVIGKKEESLIHPLVIISCKIWYDKNWLDEDREVFDNVRRRYPYVLGYSLCTNLSASQAALISCQRTGMKVFNLSKDDKFPEIISDINSKILPLLETGGHVK